MDDWQKAHHNWCRYIRGMNWHGDAAGGAGAGHSVSSLGACIVLHSLQEVSL